MARLWRWGAELRAEAAQAMAETALVLAGVFVVAAVAVFAMGPALRGVFEDTVNLFP